MNRVSIILMASFFLMYFGRIQSTTDSNMEKLNSASNTDCSDKWSRLDLDEVKIQMEKSTEILSSGKTFITFILIWIGLEVCFVLSCVMAVKGACKSCGLRGDDVDDDDEFQETPDPEAKFM